MTKKRERSVERRRYDPSGFDEAEEAGRKAAKTDSGRSLRKRNATTTGDASSPVPPRGGSSRIAPAPRTATPTVKTPDSGSAHRFTLRSTASRASRANVSGAKPTTPSGQSRKRSTGTRGPGSKGRTTHRQSPPLEPTSSKEKGTSQPAKPRTVDPDEIQGTGSVQVALHDVGARTKEYPIILEDSSESSDDEYHPDLRTLMQMKAAANENPSDTEDAEEEGEPDQNPLLYSRPLYSQEYPPVSFNLGVLTARLMDEAMMTSHLNEATEGDYELSDRRYPSMETTPEANDG